MTEDDDLLAPGVRRVRPDDHFMILTDTDATPMHIGALQVFDVSADRRPGFFEAIRAHIDARLGHTPLLAVLRESPEGFDSDVWVDVADYDRDHHFLRVSEPLDEPGLRARVAQLLMERLDLSRPPFRVHVFDNLADGRAAIYLRVHHGVVDGIGFQSILGLLGDDSPPAAGRRSAGVLPDPASWRAAAEARFAALEPLAHEKRERIRKAIQRLKSAALAPRAETPVLKMSGATSRQRSYQTLSVPLERMRAIGKRLGGTVNDVFLAVSATAIRDYLMAIDDLPAAPLVANSARSYRRPEHGAFGNRITAINPQLATHIADPLARLRTIRQSMAEELARSAIEEELLDAPEKPWGARDRRAKIAQRAASGASVLAGNVSLSNVPGPAARRSMAGFAVLANHPVPLLGNGRILNITARRNAESLDLGISADPTRIADVDAIRHNLIRALDLYESLCCRARADEGLDRPTIPNLLRDLARRFGDGGAFVRGGRRLSFRELERESARLSLGLLASGCGKGSRVGLLMPASPEFALAFMAITRIGAIVVPMSTLYAAPELHRTLRHADIDTLVIAPGFLKHDYLERLEQALPSLKAQTGRRLLLSEAPYLRSIHVWGPCDRPWAHVAPDSLLGAGARLDDGFLESVEAEVAPADLIALIYTSGSTAEPKGVAHTQGGVIRESRMLSVDYRRLEPGAIVASNRVFFWVAGLSATFFYGLHEGVCTLLTESGAPAEVAEAMLRHGAQYFVGTAAIPDIRREIEARDPNRTMIRIHQEVCGVAVRDAPGAPWRFVSEALETKRPASIPAPPLARIPNGYGMSETFGSHAFEPVPDLLPQGKEGACGRPIPGVEHRIVDPVSGVELGAGEPGELWVRGFSLMAGLVKKERGETFTPEGWYRTGDVCVRDAEGYLTFKGRLGDMVKISGANVAPAEVELCLNAEPGIRESVVVGVRGPDGEPVLMAAALTTQDFHRDEARLLARLREQLSSFKVPKRIVFLDDAEMPRLASGKVAKPALRELLARRLTDA